MEKTMSKICNSCGQELHDAAVMCSLCGEQITAPAPLPAQNPYLYAAPTPPAQNPFGYTTPQNYAPNQGYYDYYGYYGYAQPVRQQSGELLFRFLQIVSSFVLAVIMFLFPFWTSAFSFTTPSGSNTISDEFSLLHIIDSLVQGTERYNPSVLSIVMGVTVFIFIFATAFFWLISAITTLIRKGENGMRRMSVILTCFTVWSVCMLPYLSYALISHFKSIYARSLGIQPKNINGVSSIATFIWAGVVVLFIVLIWIFMQKRKGKERLVYGNV